MQALMFLFVLPFAAAICLALVVVITARAKRLMADSNSIDARAEFLTLAAPAAANSGVGPIANDPMMMGQGTSPGFGLAGVVQSSYTLPSGLVPTGNVSVAFIGVFALSVVAKSGTGGTGSGKAINPGDKLYYSGATYDATTGWLYGGVLCADSTNGAYFGNSLDAITSGSAATVRVRLKVGG
jgi:hypothetical protein